MWILFDARNIYIAARCRDSHPERIIANDMRRDGSNVSQNDNVSVIIDTFHDRRNGYEFLMNSIGGAWDTQVTDERDTNRNWNTVWIPRSRRDAEGWTLEMAIPFRSLRYRGSGPQTWGINIRRNVRWKNELSYLSPVPRQYGARGILRLSQAATLVGLEAPPAALNLDVKPYAVGNLKADRAIDPAFENDVDGDAGFDVKYGITQSLAADFTYRTDFAQVEDDDQQVNLTRFNLLFPEKRDFFLEGQGIFAFGGASTTPPTGAATSAPVNTPVMFFSRRIGLSDNRAVPIEVGGRMTGKAGRYSIGLLDIQTDDSPEAREPSTNFAVVRLKRDILRRSYVGVIGTYRSDLPGGAIPPTVRESSVDNTLFGVDANLAFFQSLTILGYYAGTRHGRLRRRRSQLSRALRLRCRSSRRPGRDAGSWQELQARDGLPPPLGVHRVPRSAPNQPAAAIDPRGPPLQLRGGARLPHRRATGASRTGRRASALRTEMQSGDSWGVGYNRDFEFVPAPFEIAGTLVPPGAYHMSTGRGNYTLGTQRHVSGDISAAHGSFYGGTRTDLAYRGRAEAHDAALDRTGHLRQLGGPSDRSIHGHAASRRGRRSRSHRAC